MKTIDTLVQDIYEVVDKGADVPEPDVQELGSRLASIITDKLNEKPHKPELRMSNIGTPCNRKLWYKVQGYEGEKLSAPAKLKFLFGHILEELLLFLAKVAGHKVEGQQDELEIAGIKGHRDAIIDGVTTDVKSASTYSFRKFAEGRLHEDDAFGYIDQLQSYIHCGESDGKVTNRDEGAFLVIDKTLGNVCLDRHQKSNFPIEKIYEYKKEVVKQSEPPARKYKPVPDGKSGNMKLDTVCSYCEFKRTCWPGMRTFLYANKPIHLVEVSREPKVPELKNAEEISDTLD